MKSSLYAGISGFGAGIRALAYASGFYHPPVIYQGNGRILTRTVHRNRMICFANDFSITPSLLLNGLWEPHVTRLLLKVIPRQPGTFVIEVGANIGYFSVLIGKKLNAGKMHVFEAAQDVCELLRDNLLLNSLDGSVTVHNKAVVDTNRIVEFTELDRHKGAGTILSFGEDYLHHYGEHGTIHRTEGISLDAEFNAVANLDLLKIDAEGAEPLILKGASEILKRSKNSVVICEFNRAMLAASGDPAELLSTMQAFGYRSFIINETGRTRAIAFDELKDIAFAELLFVKG